MNVRDVFNKRVTLDTTDNIEQKIDKLPVMMGKLVTEGEGQNKPLKLCVYQSNRGRGQTRCNYDQGRYQGRFRSNSAFRGHSRYNKIWRKDTHMILIVEVVMGIILEVVRDL